MNRQAWLALALATVMLAACGGDEARFGEPQTASPPPSGGSGGGGVPGGGGGPGESPAAFAGYYTGQRTNLGQSAVSPVVVLAADSFALALSADSGMVDELFPDRSGSVLTGSAFAHARDGSALPNGLQIDSGNVDGLLSAGASTAELLLSYDGIPDATLELVRDNAISTGFTASIDRIAGSYAGSWNTGIPVPIVIDNNGDISGAAGACEFGGIISPAFGALNVYDIVITDTCSDLGGYIGLASLLPAGARDPERLFVIASADAGYRAATLTR